eukprot:TRINITY_DN2368_c0_g1_i1.p1 TRINITY_DN2368_c0_g1~~TRINITY_DN2368_c0_g1_i1.p1  ORF type:complete len:311 (+),score=63.22 TRINITY_DN2368_c0_g1_i1:102-935(+)
MTTRGKSRMAAKRRNSRGNGEPSRRRRSRKRAAKVEEDEDEDEDEYEAEMTPSPSSSPRPPSPSPSLSPSLSLSPPSSPSVSPPVLHLLPSSASPGQQPQPASSTKLEVDPPVTYTCVRRTVDPHTGAVVWHVTSSESREILRVTLPFVCTNEAAQPLLQCVASYESALLQRASCKAATFREYSCPHKRRKVDHSLPCNTTRPPERGRRRRREHECSDDEAWSPQDDWEPSAAQDEGVDAWEDTSSTEDDEDVADVVSQSDVGTPDHRSSTDASRDG